MYGYIYKTTNIINNKIYVGQHKAPKFMGRRYLGSGILLTEAIKKYGRKNFICELLDTAETFKELNQKEILWISKLDATNSAIGYNISPGGQPDDIHTLVLGAERKLVAEADVEYYLALGWEDVRSEAYQRKQHTKQCRLYRRSHPNSKVKEHIHYLNNKDKYIRRAKKWATENSDKLKQWQEANKDRINQKRKDAYKNNPEVRARRLETSRKYREAHKEELLEKQRKRRQLEKELNKNI